MTANGSIGTATPGVNAPAVMAGVVDGAGNLHPNWIGDKYIGITLNAASGTTPQAILTGSPGYYITRIFIAVDPNCTISGGGMVAVTVTD